MFKNQISFFHFLSWFTIRQKCHSFFFKRLHKCHTIGILFPVFSPSLRKKRKKAWCAYSQQSDVHTQRTLKELLCTAKAIPFFFLEHCSDCWKKDGKKEIKQQQRREDQTEEARSFLCCEAFNSRALPRGAGQDGRARTSDSQGWESARDSMNVKQTPVSANNPPPQK